MSGEMKLLGCPFCAHVGLDFGEGSTFRWLAYSCAGCGVGSETRIQTLGEGDFAEWRAKAEADAIAAWNTRASPPPLEDGWMDISGAPKDGTEVLAWREDCGQFIASYTSADAFPLTQEEIDATDEETLFAKDWFTQWPQAIRLDGSEVPTKYRLLPPPPAALEPKEQHD